MKGFAAVLVAALTLTGCGFSGSRSVSQWMEDRATTVRVKTRLAEVVAADLPGIDIDTYEGTVYLTGGVDTPEMKRRAEEAAKRVPYVDVVVNNLHVVRPGPAASPRTDAPASAVPHVLAGGGRLVRLEAESGTPTWTRYGGYDSSGRRIATVFAVSTAVLGDGGVTEVPVDLSVDQLSVYPDGAISYVVMWHDKRVEAASHQ